MPDSIPNTRPWLKRKILRSLYAQLVAKNIFSGRVGAIIAATGRQPIKVTLEAISNANNMSTRVPNAKIPNFCETYINKSIKFIK